MKQRVLSSKKCPGNELRLLVLILVLGTAWLSSPEAFGQRDSPPNVLLIIVDDLRPLVGAYGAEFMHTPNMDRLASEGTMFRRAYANWPVCGPSRASLLSGLRPDTSRVYYIGNRIRSKAPDIVTLPEQFKRNGYHTVSVGKVYHHGDEDLQAWSQEPWRVDTALENWQGYASEQTQQTRVARWREALEEDPNLNLGGVNGPAVERADLSDAAYRDGKIALRAVEEIRNNTHRPFFLAVGFVKPHLPFAAPEAYWSLYDPASFDLPDSSRRPIGTTDIPYIYSELESYPDIEPGVPLAEEKVRELMHGYFASVSFVDAQIGLLLAELDRLGLRQDTVVALVGDHGFHLGEQGIWAKHSLFELSLHTPLIVSPARNGEPATVVDRPVELVDLAATLVELAGIEDGFSSDGTTLVPLMRSPEASYRPWALSQYQHFRDPFREVMGYSLRTPRYRFTLWRQKGEDQWFASELYDLGNQPEFSAGEQVNLVGAPAHAEVESALLLAASSLASTNPQ